MNNIKIHKGEYEINEIRKEYLRLQHHPNSDFEHFLLVCKIRKEVVMPVVFSYWKDGECKSIVVSRIENIIIKPQIGYLKFPGVRSKTLTIIHEGILGKLDQEGSRLLLLSILDLMKDQDLDVVSFNHLSEYNEELLDYLRNIKLTIGVKNPKWTIHRMLTLEHRPGFLLEKMRSKHRSKIKRKEKDLESDYRELINWVWITVFDDIKTICIKMENVAKRTYQRGLGAGFIDDYETRQRLSYFAKRGQLRVMLLEYNDNPICFWYGIVYKNVFHPMATGYKPEFEKYEVGTLTLLRAIDNLIKEGVEKVDFGLGDAYYKERFSDISWRETNVNLFSNSPKGRFLHTYMTAAVILEQKLIKIVKQIKAVDKIKRIWRRKIRPN